MGGSGKEGKKGGREEETKEEGFNLVSLINALKFWIRNQETTILYVKHIFFQSHYVSFLFKCDIFEIQ